ncbi:MAG: hypothetical protein ACC628_19230, partial [Pirellulaceae bacterium]
AVTMMMAPMTTPTANGASEGAGFADLRDIKTAPVKRVHASSASYATAPGWSGVLRGFCRNGRQRQRQSMAGKTTSSMMTEVTTPAADHGHGDALHHV